MTFLDVCIVYVRSADQTSFERSSYRFDCFPITNHLRRFIEHLVNTTISDKGPDTSNWGSLHLIGHSLGAHICGFAAKELKKRHSKWLVQRITGLDPAQPCFRNTDPTIHVHSNDAPFVDIIHTNGRFFTSLGLGFPEPIGNF